MFFRRIILNMKSVESDMDFLNSNIKQFKSILADRNIICFGSGKGFQTFCNLIDEALLVDRISYVVDNKSSKWGIYCNSQGRNVKIISPDELRKIFNQHYVLVVTCQYLQEILDQVNSYSELDQGKCFFYSYLCNDILCKKALQARMPPSMRTHKEIKIPKVIHYCWFGHNPLPERYKEWMKSWKKYCPDYEIVEWNESNYDITKNEYMKQAYEAKRWGFVPDYARLDIIYEHGGIYLDTDVEIVKPLDNLLYQNSFCGMQSDLRIALGLGFGAKKNMNIIKKMRELYNEKKFYREEGKEKIKVDPDYQTEFLLKNGYEMTGDFQEIDGLRIYPAKVLSGLIGYELLSTDDTYTIHHFDGSWVDDTVRKRAKYLKELYLRTKLK